MLGEMAPVDLGKSLMFQHVPIFSLQFSYETCHKKVDVSQVPTLFEPWLSCRRRPGQSQLPHPSWGRVGAALRQLYGGAVVAQELPATWMRPGDAMAWGSIVVNSG